MSRYYIKATIDGQDKFLSFDSTSTVQKIQTGSATSFPVEDGQTVSDNYVNNNSSINFTGVITDVKTRTRQASNTFNLSTSDFISTMNRIKNEVILFSVHTESAASGTSKSNGFEVLENCVFENISITQDSVVGTSALSNAYRMSFTAKQIRLPKRAATELARSPILSGLADVKKTKAGNKQEISRTTYLEEDTGKIISEAEYEKLFNENPSLAVANYIPIVGDS